MTHPILVTGAAGRVPSGPGVATVRSETRNQRGETVQVLVARLAVPVDRT
jgi:hypothetical protein